MPCVSVIFYLFELSTLNHDELNDNMSQYNKMFCNVWCVKIVSVHCFEIIENIHFWVHNSLRRLKWYIIKWNPPNWIYSQRHFLIKLARLWPYITMWLSCVMVCCAWFVIIDFFVLKSRKSWKTIYNWKWHFQLRFLVANGGFF